MQILGYIGYATLIFMAITWTLGVRLRLGLGIHTILGALFFLVSAIAVGVSGINKLHSWWLLSAGFLFIFLTVAILARRVPILFPLVKLIASVYARIVRLGIPAERVQSALEADARESIDRIFSQKSDKP